MNIRLTAAVIAITAATTVFAHQGATGIAKERMDAMSTIAANLKSVNQMLRGTMPFDEATVRASMDYIATQASMLPHKFPEGSDAAPSEAGPAIWTDAEGFNAIFKELETSASDLAALAGDQDAVAAGFRNVAKTCKACHANYRIDRD